MAAIICGSLAFDTIMNFEGRFAEQILPDQIHILNVSFLVPSLRRDFGGCAGNIAYALKLLGGTPLPMAAVGTDGAGYLQRLRDLGISTELVLTLDDLHTAQCMITTDTDNNQITAFHPGAMMEAHRNRIEARPDVALGITERTGWSLADISRKVRGLVVTLAGEGCDVWVDGAAVRVAGVPAEAVVDPTGCGDAWRGALLHGLEQGWDLLRCAELGNRIGARKIAQRGPQNYTLD